MDLYLQKVCEAEHQESPIQAHKKQEQAGYYESTLPHCSFAISDKVCCPRPASAWKNLANKMTIK